MNTNFTIKGKKLVRSRDERMVAGVAGGVAKLLDIDPVLVRLGFVGLAIISLGTAAIAYAAAWAIIPEEGTVATRTDDPFADNVDDPQRTGTSIIS